MPDAKQPVAQLPADTISTHQPYEPPRVDVLGSLADLTQDHGNAGGDGVIGFASV